MTDRLIDFSEWKLHNEKWNSERTQLLVETGEARHIQRAPTSLYNITTRFKGLIGDRFYTPEGSPEPLPVQSYFVSSTPPLKQFYSIDWSECYLCTISHILSIQYDMEAEELAFSVLHNGVDMLKDVDMKTSERILVRAAGTPKGL